MKSTENVIEPAETRSVNPKIFTMWLFIVSIIMAREPLPEMGCNKAVGIASVKRLSIPDKSTTYFIPSTIKPRTPEFRRHEMATSIPTKYGIIRTDVSKPPLAPSTKVEKMSIFFQNAARMKDKIKLNKRPLLRTLD